MEESLVREGSSLNCVLTLSEGKTVKYILHMEESNRWIPSAVLKLTCASEFMRYRNDGNIAEN